MQSVQTQPVRIVRNEEKRQFEAYLDSERAAVATYELRPGVLDLTHTVVRREYRGRGIGEQLAEAVLDTVRAEGLRLVPTCPFIAEYVAANPRHADLLAP